MQSGVLGIDLVSGMRMGKQMGKAVSPFLVNLFD
jgi:hypothetical protein